MDINIYLDIRIDPDIFQIRLKSAHKSLNPIQIYFKLTKIRSDWIWITKILDHIQFIDHIQSITTPLDSPQPGARATDGVETKPSQAIIGFWLCAFMTHGIILKGLRNIHASVTFKNQNHKRGGLRWWPFDLHIQLITKRQRNVARTGEMSNQRDKFGTDDSPQWPGLSPRNMQSCTFELEGYISNFRWGNLAFSETIRIRERGDILETEPVIYSLHHW